jgi:hypothetical protein
MSLRPGNNKKKGQKHQNTYTYHHNKGSLISRKILSSPLDLLCDRCLDILSWKVKFNKYHPLKNPGKCNQCLGKNIYKAYRTICDSCATKEGKKRCTKCGEEVENYAKPDVRNNPEAGVKKKSPVMELIKTLKKKYQKTVYRKINTGVRIEYDEEKGIIDEETKEVIISLDKIVKSDDDDDEDEENGEDENDVEEDNNDEEDKKEEKNEIKENKKEEENINGKEGEDIDTSSKPEE